MELDSHKVYGKYARHLTPLDKVPIFPGLAHELLHLLLGHEAAKPLVLLVRVHIDAKVHVSSLVAGPTKRNVTKGCHCRLAKGGQICSVLGIEVCAFADRFCLPRWADYGRVQIPLLGDDVDGLFQCRLRDDRWVEGKEGFRQSRSVVVCGVEA